MTKLEQKPKITTEKLNAFFTYDDGKIFWKIKPAKQYAIGSRAGSISNSDNHRYVRIYGWLFPEHRVIYIMLNGEINDNVLIDHIDCDPLNNRIANLRISTVSQNLCNRGKQVNNTSGYKGVVFDKRDGKWVARIFFNGKGKSLGYHRSAEAAHEAYKKAAIELHGEFAKY